MLAPTSQSFAGLAGSAYGRADARPPLVLLHGLSFDRTMWSDALEKLAALDPGRRVVALDLPGHGESPDRDSYRMDEVVDAVHAAVAAAGAASPVIVGHSISAIVASVYAGRYPTRGVVNVDQTLEVAPFAARLHSLRDAITGPGFDGVWSMLWASMGIEQLPPHAQELLAATSTPRQEVAAGYWRDVLDRSVPELVEWAESILGMLRTRRVPYLVVAGDELEPGYRTWLAQELPQARITVLPWGGHFPQLAHPELFAECLAATGGYASSRLARS